MKVTSLGFRTDLALLQHTGSEVEDHDDHLVIRTPENPSYFWGNFVLFAHAPTVDRAMDAFAAAFPDADHVSIGVDDARMDAETRASFGEVGVTVDDCVVLTSTSMELAAIDADVRPLATSDDWEQRALLSHAFNPEVDADTFLDFARRKAAMEQALVDAGLGQRFGAFVDGQLVSTAGCFEASPGLARYQAVETHPDHRRQGFAGAVVRAAGRAALDAGARRVVIVADEDGDGVRLYRRLGLADAERQLMLERRSGPWAAS